MLSDDGNKDLKQLAQSAHVAGNDGEVLLDVAVPVSDVLSKMNAKKARKKSARAE